MLSTVKVTKPCAHCGLATQTKPTDEPVFCCHGCQGAYALIHQMGLDTFYDLQFVNGHSPNKPATTAGDSLKKLDALADQAVPTSDGFCEIRLAIHGLHCAACTWLIEKMPSRLPGLKTARVRMSDQSVQLHFDQKQTSLSQIAEPLQRLGYTLAPWSALEDRDAMLEIRRQHWRGMALAFFLAANSMWIGIALYAGEATGMAAAHATFLRCVGTALGVLAAVFPGRIFFETAWQAFRSRTPHVDIPVALAIGAGTLGSVTGAWLGHGHIYFDSIASLILLLRVGRYLQFRAQYKAGVSIDRLFRMTSSFANRLDANGNTTIVPTPSLQLKDRILVKSGEALPVDGRVIRGSSNLDCAWLTGESQPIPIGEGERAVGGSINLTAPIEMEVEAVGETSQLGTLNQLVRQAASQKTPLMHLADRVGGWFVWTVLGLSVLTLVGWTLIANGFTALEHTVSLLTIACPCALALAAPLVITVAMGRAARRSIWIHQGDVLESLAKPGIAWFDKTGTLTHGALQVLDWSGDKSSLELAAILERQVAHPIAKALVRYAEERLPTLDEPAYRIDSALEQVHGRGVHGRVKGHHVSVGSLVWMIDQDIRVRSQDLAVSETYARRGHAPLFIAVDRVTCGVAELGDCLRPEAKDVMNELRNRGWQIGVLSGDRQEVVDAIADQLQLDVTLRTHFLGELSPEEKLSVIRSSKQQYPGRVMMVGDGINDAAALAAADVGIAVRSSEDVSLRSAPVYIPGNRLIAILELIDASRASIRSIYRCFAASLIYNSITICLAIAGWMHPLLAALLMPISGITVLTMAITSKTFEKPKESGRLP